jgi:hypothetical protein
VTGRVWVRLAVVQYACLGCLLCLSVSAPACPLRMTCDRLVSRRVVGGPPESERQHSTRADRVCLCGYRIRYPLWGVSNYKLKGVI